ncbi:MAG: hypothetical protein WCT13_02775 [Patescibacteria group bacterium]|jgi:hypothetical protein
MKAEEGVQTANSEAHLADEEPVRDLLVTTISLDELIREPPDSFEIRGRRNRLPTMVVGLWTGCGQYVALLFNHQQTPSD